MTEPARAEYKVRVAAFEGPLDLLLHLIRINEMDILDIPIVEITRQYQEYLDLMQTLDLEVAGDYLLMAATLMHIKSKILLPREPDLEGAAPEDPRAELTRQLVEYQRIKHATENLQALESVRGLVWNRGQRVFEEFEGEEVLVLDMYAVLGAMKKVLARMSARERLALRTEDFSVAEKVEWLTGLLETDRSVSLFHLVESMRSVGEIIATFLAVLELLRLRRILALQRTMFEEILLAPVPAKETAS